MSLFSWQCQNLCLLSLAFIIDWRVVLAYKRAWSGTKTGGYVRLGYFDCPCDVSLHLVFFPYAGLKYSICKVFYQAPVSLLQGGQWFDVQPIFQASCQQQGLQWACGLPWCWPSQKVMRSGNNCSAKWFCKPETANPSNILATINFWPRGSWHRTHGNFRSISLLYWKTRDLPAL